VTASQFRLVTRSDFDGLVCGVLLKELDLIDEIAFVHHSSELMRNGARHPANYVIDPEAFSAARVVWRHFGGAQRFTRVREDLLTAVDKADAAQFTREEILDPQGWPLLSFLMDSRTGLGRFRQFRISNYDLMMQLIDECRTHSVEDILQLPDVKERIDLFRSHEPQFRAQLMRCSEVKDDVVVLDLRKEETIYAGNRFMVYALFPQCRVSMHVLWGVKQQNTVFAIGKSILDRTSPIDVGAICLSYGGGGHKAAGTCQIDNAHAETIKAELVGKLASPR
jgi:nanoRNase/pAp phosphatase (c-di-AMP/oligoRNAs hydrolase)